jgi:hypothetical protein
VIPFVHSLLLYRARKPSVLAATSASSSLSICVG